MVAISFLHPELLWLLLVVPVILFWPNRVRTFAHAGFRAVVLTLVTLAMAAPVRLTADDADHQVFVVENVQFTGEQESNFRGRADRRNPLR